MTHLQKAIEDAVKGGWVSTIESMRSYSEAEGVDEGMMIQVPPLHDFEEDDDSSLSCAKCGLSKSYSCHNGGKRG